MIDLAEMRARPSAVVRPQSVLDADLPAGAWVDVPGRRLVLQGDDRVLPPLDLTGFAIHAGGRWLVDSPYWNKTDTTNDVLFAPIMVFGPADGLTIRDMAWIGRPGYEGNPAQIVWMRDDGNASANDVTIEGGFAINLTADFAKISGAGANCVVRDLYVAWDQLPPGTEKWQSGKSYLTGDHVLNSEALVIAEIDGPGTPPTVFTATVVNGWRSVGATPHTDLGQFKPAPGGTWTFQRNLVDFDDRMILQSIARHVIEGGNEPNADNTIRYIGNTFTGAPENTTLFQFDGRAGDGARLEVIGNILPDIGSTPLAVRSAIAPQVTWANNTIGGQPAPSGVAGVVEPLLAPGAGFGIGMGLEL